MEEDSILVEEVGPGAFAVRRGNRVRAVEEPPEWVQLTLPLEEPREPDFDDEEATTEFGQFEDPHDPVSHPRHYLSGGIETLDFIEAKELDYHLGNVVKYVSRAGKKDPEKLLEDLKKAQTYLNRRIALLEGGNSGHY